VPPLSYRPWDGTYAYQAAVSALTWLEEDALEIARTEDGELHERWILAAMKYRAARFILLSPSH